MSSPIPNDVVGVRRGVPPEVERKLQAGLLKVAASPSGATALRALYDTRANKMWLVRDRLGRCIAEVPVMSSFQQGLSGLEFWVWASGIYRELREPARHVDADLLPEQILPIPQARVENLFAEQHGANQQ